jgi:YfiH family protein
MNRSDVRAFFTTKALHEVKRDTERTLAEKFDLSADRIYLPVQEHTNKVHIIEAGSKPVVADAVITSTKNLLIGVLVADCVPVLLYDREGEVIGAVHAGWRGTAGRILPDAIEMMRERFRSSPANISVAIGPSIGQCCYEVGEDVRERVMDATGDGGVFLMKNEKCFADLSFANKIQALDAGVPEESIWLSGECTCCNPKKYHSYRYSGEKAGRQGGFIGMW